MDVPVEIDAAAPVSVCFVAPKTYPLFNPEIKGVLGGAEVDMYLLATQIAQDPAFEVSAIVADYGQADEEVLENVRLLKGLSFAQHPIKSAARIWKACRQARAQIYFLKTFSLGLPLVGEFCRMYGRHLVYRTASAGEADGTYLRRHPLLGRLCYRALRRASALYVQNQSDQMGLKGYIGTESTVLPNGHRIPSPQDRARETILWVGRSALVKQALRFIDLAKRYSQRSFTMICQRATDDVHYDMVVSQAQALPNLTHLPHVPFHQIDEYFLRAKVLVNTSDSEGFPNTFIQAAKCGCPILSYKVNPDDFLNRYRCGLCAEGDWERFVQQLGILLEEEAAGEFSLRGRAYAVESHDVREIAEAYKSRFRSLTQSRQI